MKNIKVLLPDKISQLIDDNITDPKLNLKAMIAVGYLIYSYSIQRLPFLVYIPIPKVFKNSIIGNKTYYKVWSILEDINILKPRPGRSFSPKYKVCKYYRFNIQLLTYDASVFEFKTPARFRKSIISNDPLCVWVKSNLSHIRLNLFNQKTNLSHKLFDKCLSRKFRFDLDNNKVSIKNSRKWKTYSTNDINIDEHLPYYQNTFEPVLDNLIQAVNSNKSNCTISSTNHRLNHILTNLDKMLFPYVTLNGDYIAVLDLCNSQPLLLAILLYRSIIIPDAESIGYNPYMHDLSSKLIEGPNREVIVSEITTFLEESKRGNIYEYFGNNYYGRQITSDERNNIKTSFLAAIYGNVQYESQDMKIFKSVFPSVSIIIDEFKHYMISLFSAPTRDKDLDSYRYSISKGVKNNDEAGSDYLSVYLQRLESRIFIREVLPLLKEQGHCVIPIHDSYVCASNQSAIVKSAVNDALSSILGENMFTLKQENYGTVQAEIRA